MNTKIPSVYTERTEHQSRARSISWALHEARRGNVLKLDVNRMKELLPPEVSSQLSHEIINIDASIYALDYAYAKAVKALEAINEVSAAYTRAHPTPGTRAAKTGDSK